jgi:hypothetical protein
MTQTEIENVTNEILRALVAAPEERKAAALKALRGELAEGAPKPVNGPLLMGMKDGARYLGTSRSTLWRILQAGKIQKVELFAGSYRVRKEDLIALAAGELGFTYKHSGRGRSKKARCSNDPRFLQLKSLANDGNEEAVSDLFKEFDYDHAADRFGPAQSERTNTDSESKGAPLRQAQGDRGANAAGQGGGK